MHPFSLCAPLLAALLIIVGGSPGGAYATAPLTESRPAAVGAPVPSGGPVPYGGTVRCSVPGDCLPAVVTVAPGPGAGRARPALPVTGGGTGMTVAALGAVLVIMGAVTAAVGRDLRNRRRRAAGSGRAKD